MAIEGNDGAPLAMKCSHETTHNRANSPSLYNQQKEKNGYNYVCVLISKRIFIQQRTNKANARDDDYKQANDAGRRLQICNAFFTMLKFMC